MAFFTAWIYSSQPFRDITLPLLRCLVYSVIYIYTFCISNQINSIEEDKINKPYRALPTGYVTLPGTRKRLLFYNVVYLLVGGLYDILWWSLAWQIVTYLLNFRGWSHHWFTKNVLGMTLGTIILLNAQFNIATESVHLSISTIAYIFIISLWAGVALPIQDMRDQEGDREMGRKTLPLVYGDHQARKILFINFALVCPIIFLLLLLTQLPFIIIITSGIPVAILVISIATHWLIAFRILRFKTPREDNLTYHIYVILFCISIPIICVL
nr:UbiA family prenyltransferase [Chitinophaga hostae]